MSDVSKYVLRLIATVTTHSSGCPGSETQEGEERVLHNTQERGRTGRHTLFVFPKLHSF